MQDQLIGRIWDAQHDQFSADVSSAVGAASTRLRGLFGGVPMPLKAMAAVLAMSVTSLIFSVPSYAAENQINVRASSVAVSHTDLDLRTRPGLTTLERRVRFAARQLCDPDFFRVSSDAMAGRDCYHAAVDGARPQIERAVARHARGLFAGGGTITVAR